MLDDFGFPASAGDFRFQAESRIVRRLAGDVKRDGEVLDLGSGIGFWAEDFARRFWRVAGCHGLCRADFFVEKSTQRVLFNEVNTMPGFTPISMYPRLWAEAGIQSAELVDSLLRIALERAELSSATRA